MIKKKYLIFYKKKDLLFKNKINKSNNQNFKIVYF